jgi:hypothetical protein
MDKDRPALNTLIYVVTGLRDAPGATERVQPARIVPWLYLT